MTDGKVYPDLTDANARITRYVCGTCGHDDVDVWAMHQEHYEAHRDDEAPEEASTTTVIVGTNLTELQILGLAIRSAIHEHGWTQKHVAGAAGISEKHLSQIINGRADPSIGTLAHVAHIVGLELTMRAITGSV